MQTILLKLHQIYFDYIFRSSSFAANFNSIYKIRIFTRTDLRTEQRNYSDIMDLLKICFSAKKIQLNLVRSYEEITNKIGIRKQEI